MTGARVATYRMAFTKGVTRLRPSWPTAMSLSRIVPRRRERPHGPRLVRLIHEDADCRAILDDVVGGKDMALVEPSGLHEYLAPTGEKTAIPGSSDIAVA